MEFRLATKLDLTPDLCKQVLAQAKGYNAENPIDKVSAEEILAVFIEFAEGKVTDPHFWLGFKEDNLVGYMITLPQEKNKEIGLLIRQAYIDTKFRGNGVAQFCLGVLEKKAKEIGFPAISLESHHNPQIYGRFIRRYGYNYMSTEYRKEI